MGDRIKKCMFDFFPKKLNMSFCRARPDDHNKLFKLPQSAPGGRRSTPFSRYALFRNTP